MSTLMLENTKDDIQKAYAIKSLAKISKETLYVFDRVIHFLLSTSKNRLKGITFKCNEINFKEDYILSEKNYNHLLKTLKTINQLTLPISDIQFGKMRVDIERWYYQMGGEGIYFEYQEGYLLTPKEAANQLGISNVTLNKQTKQGLEIVDTTSHRKIPKHAIELWKDPAYAISMQMLFQEKKMKNQSPEDRLKEVQEEITELQKKYKAKTVHEAMIKQHITDLDGLDDLSELRHWEDLEEEREEILEKLIEGKEIE